MRLSIRRRPLGCMVALALLAAVVLGSVVNAEQRITAASTYSHKVFLPVAYRDWLPVDPADYLGVWMGDGDERSAFSAREAGAGYAVVSLSWSVVEPSKPANPADRHWEAYDSLIAAVRAQGIVPIVQIRDNPSWAAPTPCGPLNDANLLDFEAFLVAAVEHYSVSPYRVSFWEFYNEPDNNSDAADEGVLNGGCWAARADGASRYADLLSRARRIVHDVQRWGWQYSAAAMVVFGGLGYEVDRGRFDLAFADKVFQAGGGSSFDIMNLHYLSAFEVPYQPAGYAHPWTSIAQKIGEIRSKLPVERRLDMPIMVSKVSWVTNNDDNDQANYVAKVLIKGLSAQAWFLMWFSLNWDDATAEYGLTNPNLTPRPAYYAYRTFSREFGRLASPPRNLASWEVGASGVDGYESWVGPVGQQRRRWVIWATGGNVQINIPADVTAAFDNLGNPIPLTGSRTYTLTQSPVYFRY